MSIFVFNCFALDFVYLVPLRAALAGVSLACRRGGLFYSFGLEFFLHTTLHIHLLICLDDLGMLFFFSQSILYIVLSVFSQYSRSQFPSMIFSSRSYHCMRCKKGGKPISHQTQEKQENWSCGRII